MRNLILWWSTGNGAILGFLAGLALVTIGAIALPFVLPVAAERALERHGMLIAAITLIVPALCGMVLGYLEGKLKLY